MKKRIFLVSTSFIHALAVTLSGIVVTRTYSKTDLGTFQQGVLLYSVLSVIVAFGAPKAVFFFGKRGHCFRRVMRHLFFLLFVSNAVAGAAFYVLWPSICRLFSNPALLPFGAIVFFILALRSFNEMFAAFLVTLDRSNTLSLARFIEGLLIVFFVSVLCINGFPVGTLFFLFAAIELVKAAVIGLFYMRLPRDKESTVLNWGFLGEIARYATPLVLSIITLLFAKRIDGFIISSFMDPAAFAVYSRGAQELPIGPIIVSNIALLLMPNFVTLFNEHKLDTLSAVFHAEVRRTSVILIPLFFSLLLVSRDLIVFFYTKQYTGSVPVFVTYLFLIPIQLYTLNTVLQAMGKTAWVFYVSVVSIVANVVLSINLIGPLGMVGPAIGTVGATLSTAVLQLALINRMLEKSPAQWMPWRHLGLVSLFCTCVYAVFHLLGKLAVGWAVLPRLIVVGALSAGLQYAVLWFSGMVSREDKRAILSLLGVSGKTPITEIRH